MKKVVTWIAEDETEFETEQECWEYEHRFDGIKDSAIFLDDEFNVIEWDLEKVYDRWDLEKVYDRFIYIYIRDAEKSRRLFNVLHEWEQCFVKPEDVHNGDILKRDFYDELYIDLKKKAAKIAAELEAVGKAVASCG